MSNAGVRLSQLCKHVAVDDDFPKTIGKISSTFQKRFSGSDVLDSVPVRGKVPQPRVILAAPAQPLFDVLIQQPVVNSVSGKVRSSLTILVQCKWSARQDQVDKERGGWVSNALSSASSASVSSASSSSSSSMWQEHEPETSDRMSVYMAARGVTTRSSMPCILPLDLSSLKSIWGPTISRCHVFEMQMNPEEQRAVSDEIGEALQQSESNLSSASDAEPEQAASGAASFGHSIPASGAATASARKRHTLPAASSSLSSSSAASAALSSPAPSKRARRGSRSAEM